MEKRSESDAARIRQRQIREDNNLFSRLPAIYAASRQQGQKMLRSAGGLSIVEWRTLWDLTEAGPLTIRELADIQRTDHSLVSRALPDMRRKGYVEIHRSESDGRQMVVALTDKGRLAYERAAPTMKRRREAIRERFTPEELSQFVSYLDRFEEFLRGPIDDLILKEEVIE